MADENGKQIELSMGKPEGGGPSSAAAASHPTAQAPRPVMGWIAVASGLLGIFVNGLVFVPIAFVCSVIALFMGQGMWAFLGFLTAFVGLMTSPFLLTVLGIGAAAAYFGWSIPL